MCRRILYYMLAYLHVALHTGEFAHVRTQCRSADFDGWIGIQRGLRFVVGRTHKGLNGVEVNYSKCVIYGRCSNVIIMIRDFSINRRIVLKGLFIFWSKV